MCRARHFQPVSGFPLTSSGLRVVRFASNFQTGRDCPESFLFLLRSEVPVLSENMAFSSLDASLLASLFKVGGRGPGTGQRTQPRAKPQSVAPLRAACSYRRDVGPLPSEGQGGRPPPPLRSPCLCQDVQLTAMRQEAVKPGAEDRGLTGRERSGQRPGASGGRARSASGPRPARPARPATAPSCSCRLNTEGSTSVQPVWPPW